MEKHKTYDKYETEIEEIAEHHSHKAFLYVASDDIKQEVRNICYEALDSFDKRKASAKTYLSKCVSNRLYNLKRDLYFRYENLCSRIKCPMYNIFLGECTSRTYKEEICIHNKKNNEKMQKQIVVANPVSIHGVSDDDTGGTEVDRGNRLMKSEMKSQIISASGEWFGVCFDLLVRYGERYVNNQQVSFFRGVAKEYIYEEKQEN